MLISRREFVVRGQHVAVCAVGMSALWNIACGQSPTRPTPVSENKTPTPPTVINNPSSPYGTFHRGGFAGVTGTLAQVLTAANLNPQINSAGLMTAVNGRTPPLVPGSFERRGYFFHVRGQWFAGSVHNVTLAPPDAWDIFDWNGTNP